MLTSAPQTRTSKSSARKSTRSWVSELAYLALLAFYRFSDSSRARRRDVVTAGEMAELHVAYEVLKSAYEHLEWVTGSKQERLANVDAMLILLDARVAIQEEIIGELFSQGDGHAARS